MNKKKPSTDLVPQSQAELNEKLKDALATIDKKLASLGANVANPYQNKTSGAFKINEFDSVAAISIFNSNGVEWLLKCLATLERFKKEYEEAAQSMELTTYPVMSWQGYPVDSWISDIKNRIKLVSNAGQIAQLNQSKVELTSFLSQEDRLKDTLSKTAALLKV